MKKVILIALIGLVSLTTSFAQSINGTPIKDIDVEYVQIIGTAKAFSNKVNIQLDFGQKDSMWKAKDTQVLDENGKNVEYNSMIDALNFKSHNGYDFVQAYAITIGNSNVYHYLLKKK